MKTARGERRSTQQASCRNVVVDLQNDCLFVHGASLTAIKNFAVPGTALLIASKLNRIFQADHDGKHFKIILVVSVLGGSESSCHLL